MLDFIGLDTNTPHVFCHSTYIIMFLIMTFTNDDVTEDEAC